MLFRFSGRHRLIFVKMKSTGDIFSEATRDRLFRFASSLLGCRDDAEDAVHDILMRLWRRKSDLGAVKNPEAFAMTSVRNICIDKIRRRHGTTDEIPDGIAEERSDSWSDVEIVRRAIMALPEKQREIVHLRDIEGYSNKDISEVTGIGEDEIRVYLSRGRKAIRKYIEKEDSYGI